MKNIKALLLSVIILISGIQPSFAAPNSIETATRTIKINNVNKTVNVVTVDLNNQDIEIGVAVANDKVGGSEDFGSMIKRKNAIEVVESNMTAIADAKGSSTSSAISQTKEESIISKAEGIISAGPYLVENGKVIVDSTKEGFKEAKITTDRAQRSAIGITKNNRLIMVTGSNLNIIELAKVMVE